MAIFTIELSDVELKALEFVSVTADGWIQNAIHERCRLAMEEMVQADIAFKLSTGASISGTKEEMVMASTLPSAQQRHEDMMAQMLAGPSVTP